MFLMDSDKQSDNNHQKIRFFDPIWANTARKRLNMAVILKFKMAAEDTLKKN